MNSFRVSDMPPGTQISACEQDFSAVSLSPSQGAMQDPNDRRSNASSGNPERIHDPVYLASVRPALKRVGRGPEGAGSRITGGAR